MGKGFERELGFCFVLFKRLILLRNEGLKTLYCGSEVNEFWCHKVQNLLQFQQILWMGESRMQDDR
jgi:hypothetical protein